MKYKDDVSPNTAWDMLQKNLKTLLIDVRTKAEWNFVGIPDVKPLGKELIMAEWPLQPDPQLTANFASQLITYGALPDNELLFICRSGSRSMAAASLMTEHGYPQCYNVLEGFEGDLDDSQHRANLGGWKFKGLPWRQS